MALKRYTTRELIEIFTEMFYEQMATQKNDSELTYADDIYLDYKSKIKEFEYQLKMRQEGLNDKSIDEDSVEALMKQIKELEEGLKILKSSNFKTQQDLYNKSSQMCYNRSLFRMHLNKKLNSYYDDFILEVVFFDDVCTPQGKHEEYSKLKTKEERIDFIKKNTQITNIGLVYATNNSIKATVAVLGKLNLNDERIKELGIEMLPSEFSDLEHLTLSDTSKIRNNDLKQLFQSKIDLDKEDMEELASINIRGDVYTIKRCIDRRNNREEYYIRYTCRGTGRIYYNRLNLNNLEISEEYKPNDYESYAKAWWNLNTLGSPVSGEPIIRL